jgi:peptide/nickel transport system substrate-binding protein
MLRGYRWQLAALLTSAVLFALAVTARLTVEPEQPIVTPTPVVIAVTATPQAAFELAPTLLPANVNPVNASSPETEDVVTYREGLVGRVQRLNPLYANLNPVDRDITSLIFEGLTRMNERGEIEPSLAERWLISSSGLEYIVYLRQGIAWHDGIPFTSADVDYTMTILRDPGFTENEELASFWRTIETEALDTYIVRFRLTQPLGNFLDRLRIGILPEHALRGTTAGQLATHPFNLSPIGTGAYQLENVHTEAGVVRSISLRTAPVFRTRLEGQSQPYQLERIRFHMFDDFEAAMNALNTGSVDGFAARDRNERQLLFEIANRSGKQLINGFEPTIGTLIFNWSNDETRYFRDQRIRVALDAGLNRSTLVERTMLNKAVGATQFMLTPFWGYSPFNSRPAYDPSTARQLLQTARDRLGEQVSEAEPSETATETGLSDAIFTFTILVPNDASIQALAREIATQWRQLNLNVDVEAVDLDIYHARLAEGSFEAAIVEYSFVGSAEPDLYLLWHQGQYPDGLNYGGVDDRRISQLLEGIRREPFGVNRRENYIAFQSEFAERAIALPLYYPLFTYGLSQEMANVQIGLLSTPSDRFITIGMWRKG